MIRNVEPIGICMAKSMEYDFSFTILRSISIHILGTKTFRLFWPNLTRANKLADGLFKRRASQKKALATRGKNTATDRMSNKITEIVFVRSLFVFPFLFFFFYLFFFFFFAQCQVWKWSAIDRKMDAGNEGVMESGVVSL